ncbi:Ribosomal RNA adenine dimethylase [Trinorchestia longiramus]|nr:Ribosomal RNA adenine dimethylase [Trinorchestia longiramus]
MAKQGQMLVGRLPPLPSISEVLRMYKIHSKRSLAQNFLYEPKLTSKFVSRSAKVRGAYVCEVGPGPGSLTRAIIAQRPKHLVVVEKDARFLPSLLMLQNACKGHMSVVLGDILKFDMSKVFPSECERAWEEESPPIHVIGNLPFNVSTPIIIRWLKAISLHNNAWRYGRVNMTLAVQEEVGVRITAVETHSQRSRLSVMCQNWCEVEHVFTIPGHCFVPQPKVNSSIIKFTPRIKPLIDMEFHLFEKFIRVMFSMRQKQCKTPIQRLFPLHRRQELATKLFTVADVDPNSSILNLGFAELERLSLTYGLIVEQCPELRYYDFINPDCIAQDKAWKGTLKAQQKVRRLPFA